MRDFVGKARQSCGSANQRRGIEWRCHAAMKAPPPHITRTHTTNRIQVKRWSSTEDQSEIGTLLKEIWRTQVRPYCRRGVFPTRIRHVFTVKVVFEPCFTQELTYCARNHQRDWDTLRVLMAQRISKLFREGLVLLLWYSDRLFSAVVRSLTLKFRVLSFQLRWHCDLFDEHVCANARNLRRLHPRLGVSFP